MYIQRDLLVHQLLTEFLPPCVPPLYVCVCVCVCVCVRLCVAASFRVPSSWKVSGGARWSASFGSPNR